jgi:oligoendopeptidase F
MTKENPNSLVALYKANLQFLEHMGELARQSNEKWLQQTQQLIASITPESAFEVPTNPADLAGSIAAQTNLATRQWEKFQGTAQDALRLAAENAGTVNAALAAAIEEWLRTVTAIPPVTSVLPATFESSRHFLDLFTHMRNASAGEAPAVTGGKAAKTGRT